MMQIGALAARAGITTRTIRYYEELGIIAPEQRTEGGFRLYSEAQLRRLGIVQELKSLGLGLERIQALFVQPEAARTGGELARAFLAGLQERQEQIDARIRHLQDLRARNQRAMDVVRGCVRCGKGLVGGNNGCLLRCHHPDVPERIECAQYVPDP